MGLMITDNIYPVLDGHNDTLLHLHMPERGGGRSFFIQSDKGHIDFPRARSGGMAGGFFAIFTPNPAQEQTMLDRLIISDSGYEVLPYSAIDPAYARQFTLSVAADLFRLEEESEGQVKVVRSIDELVTCLQKGIFAIILHFEGTEVIDPQLDALEVFYQAGLRSLGIVWSRPNAFGHGVPFKYPHTPDTGPGLTPLGRELVRACNQFGILVDLAHINTRGFFDVAEISDAPLVVTHAAVHAICPSTRNLTDDQLEAIKASKGIVGLNFEVANLREDAWDDPDTPIDLMVRHIDYLVEHMGIDCVGFGSDFDGGITVCKDLRDVSGLPNLVAALREHGYDDVALRKLTRENWLRVLTQTWKS
jgi:membrane dipeptidase